MRLTGATLFDAEALTLVASSSILSFSLFSRREKKLKRFDDRLSG
jgi:hypothetical protein